MKKGDFIFENLKRNDSHPDLHIIDEFAREFHLLLVSLTQFTLAFFIANANGARRRYTHQHSLLTDTGLHNSEFSQVEQLPLERYSLRDANRLEHF
jgi:hypothetical protein